MLTEEQIKEAEKISKKEESVKLLLEFYNDAQTDGLKAMRIALNKKLLDITTMVEKADESNSDDKTFERIDRIVASLNKLPKTPSSKDEEKEGSFLERKANDKRKD